MDEDILNSVGKVEKLTSYFNQKIEADKAKATSKKSQENSENNCSKVQLTSNQNVQDIVELKTGVQDKYTFFKYNKNNSVADISTDLELHALCNTSNQSLKTDLNIVPSKTSIKLAIPAYVESYSIYENPNENFRYDLEKTKRALTPTSSSMEESTSNNSDLSSIPKSPNTFVWENLPKLDKLFANNRKIAKEHRKARFYIDYKVNSDSTYSIKSQTSDCSDAEPDDLRQTTDDSSELCLSDLSYINDNCSQANDDRRNGYNANKNQENLHKHSTFSIYCSSEILYQNFTFSHCTPNFDQLCDVTEETTANVSANATALQLIGDLNSSQRILWRDIVKDIEPNIYDTLRPSIIRIQESKFEIITSEASYLKSLDILNKLLIQNPLFKNVELISKEDSAALFSNLPEIRHCSQMFMKALDECWQNNIMLYGISKIIYENVSKHFHVYIQFCRQMGEMDRVLERLTKRKTVFALNLDILESHPDVAGLRLHSFLMLPMQRITRLPLLIDAVVSNLGAENKIEDLQCWNRTMALVMQITQQCNEAAKESDQDYEVLQIIKHLNFPMSIEASHILKCLLENSSYLIKKGKLTLTHFTENSLQRKIWRKPIVLILFADFLILAKTKSKKKLKVMDYCFSKMILTSAKNDGNNLEQSSAKPADNIITISLLKNHRGNQVELTLRTSSISDQQRWLQAFEQVTNFKSTNSPIIDIKADSFSQVYVFATYQAQEADDLSLEIGDVLNIWKTLQDGWSYGERIRDGSIGWFPACYTRNVTSTVARNHILRQYSRLSKFTRSPNISKQKAKRVGFMLPHEEM